MILSKPNHIKIYGHRGARGDLPENTLESFKYLFENNIRAYETDILISKDFIPVITHDFRLDPSYTKDTNNNWINDKNIKIIDLTYDQISQFDVGTLNKLSKYGRKFINQKSLESQKIPKLSELLKLTSDNIVEDLLINLEIKSTPVEKNLTPEPKEMVKIIINEVSHSNLQNGIIYSSFDWRVLREIKERNPKIPRLILHLASKVKYMINHHGWILLLYIMVLNYLNLLKHLVAALGTPIIKMLIKKLFKYLMIKDYLLMYGP